MEQRRTRALQALQAVEDTRSQVWRLRRTVKALQSRCGPAVSKPERSGGGFGRGQQDVWDQLVEQKALLAEKEQKLCHMEQQLERWIDLLPKPRWRMVLRCHYLDGMALSEVTQEMSEVTGREFTKAQIYRFHRSALDAAERLWPLS